MRSPRLLYCLIGSLWTLPSLPLPAAEPKFAQEGVAFLQRYCLSCHGPTKPKADLSLHTFQDDASVLKHRKLWNNVLQQVREGLMPPLGKPKPTATELDAFVRLVDDIFHRADLAAPPDPGRVTIRRLNQAEYANTVRDLIGIDFDPTGDFPSDDVGHGFDNIGDVLSISPVLMERYLAAAEAIAQRAILAGNVKPTMRWYGGRYTEPASENIPMQGDYRIITSAASAKYIEKGPVYNSVQVPADGEYILRAKVYAQREGSQPVTASLLVAGTTIPRPATTEAISQLAGEVKRHGPIMILKTVEVRAREAKTAEVIEARIPADLSIHRIIIAVGATPANEPPARLFVEWMNLEGPLDMRPATHKKLLAVDPNLPKPQQTRAVLKRLADRAYRRPATTEEVERLAQLVEATEKEGESWEAGMRLALQAVLCSPKFLFRVELDDRPTSKEPQVLDEYQLASRLSYFLWSTMPDAELFELAATKQLTPNLEAQVRRMLKDPKAQALVENFAMQWLQLRPLRNFAPDAKLFPTFDESLRQAMLQETQLFFAEIMREDRSILDFVDGNFTYLNGRLAQHYGIVDTKGNRVGKPKVVPGGAPIPRDQFVRVTFADSERGGLLGQASILSVTSNPTRTSPVKRGRWVLEQILGTPPPPAPPNVPELAEGEKAQLTGTLRQRMEQHRANPSCANCHARMDAMGFAFENFDAIGRYREKDGNFPIDPSGILPDGKRFSGPAELKQILKSRADLIARSLTEKMLTYALGRGVEHYDKRSIDKIVSALQKDNYRFSTLVTEIVRSDPFRMRRGNQP